MSATEQTPLLADPPIDDDSYRYEARSFPTEEQKHLAFVSYSITSLVSKFFELSAVLLLAFDYNLSLIPITLYSFGLLATLPGMDRVTALVASCFKSRLALLCFSIILQRLSIALFAMLLNQNDSEYLIVRLCVFVAATLSSALLRFSVLLYQLSFKQDWLPIITNSQLNLRLSFEKSAHAIAVISQILMPGLLGMLVKPLQVEEFYRILVFTAILSGLVELSLVYKLYGSCYALHLPRLPFISEAAQSDSNADGSVYPQQPVIGIITAPLANLASVATSNTTQFTSNRPYSRIMTYVKLKPIPITITFAATLINVSLLNMGPHTLWYLMKEDVDPWVVGLFLGLQVLFTLHAAMTPRRSFIIYCVGTILALIFLTLSIYAHVHSHTFLYLYCSAVVLARSGVPGINLLTRQFILDFLPDSEIRKVYKQHVAWLQIQIELAVHLLILIWSREDQFLWPISTSALFSFIGVFIIIRILTTH